MGFRTRRLLVVPMMALTAGAGLVVASSPAQAAGVTGTVEVSGTLMTRSGPALSSRVTGSLRDGQRITAVCRAAGQTVRGSIRTTGQWDRLGSGAYVSDAYVRMSGTLPPCATTTSPAAEVTYKIGTVRSADGTVNIRTGPGTSYPVKRAVLTGATVQGVCGVVGQLVKGTVRSTTQWNRLSDGGYISHAYVVTPTLHLCPGASLTPVTGPAPTPDQFLKAAVPGAQRGWREYGVPASVTIAQAILESGWGRSSLSVTDSNYFGIKCQNGRYGDLAQGCHVYNTSECDKTGKCFATTASFRIYATMANSFRDHGNFLRVNSRYKPAFGYTRDANKFIWQVWKAGYATDPNYYTKITTLMASYNLYQYDVWK
ncbi:sporangiospore maturation cell wall hydrolase GsmA [Actinoplanes subtropicus]|uniref:sporangiospore maturation cell wall hydrolase GsmA n=1 Tax=Actinoplanes subtropicus TaxID=543632 RepID=UPI0004C46F28|nr:sporangiospore maturation cell wall hydrolase GsmA [Actinoplanes subtropicus]